MTPDEVKRAERLLDELRRIKELVGSFRIDDCGTLRDGILLRADASIRGDERLEKAVLAACASEFNQRIAEIISKLRKLGVAIS